MGSVSVKSSFNMKVFLALSLLVGVSLTGTLKTMPPQTPSGGRIVGGEDALPGEFPHQVSMQHNNIFWFGSSHFCGGSVLNENFVATAAHCCAAYGTSSIKIV